ncbi:ATPase [Actinomycetota bacterium]|nr:ATPase [Actinomycetota bacterium]
MELKRKIYSSLLKWKASGGSTALLIAGARRVGKSYIAELFAKQEYRSYILIDFSKTSPELKDIFTNEQADLNLFFTKLSLLYSTKLYQRKSLIVFDEVQLFPPARQFIKHLVADGRYDFLETGSLISIKSNVEDILIPSEEEEIEMFPLDFEEFCWANGDASTVPMLRDMFEQKTPAGQAVHRKIMNTYRTYMLVGGMPQAVLQYIATKDFEAVDKTKRLILKLYKNDIAKFGEKLTSKVSSVYEEIPSQLSTKKKKYKLSVIAKSARLREYEDAFYWLSDAKIINTCFNACDPNVGLKMSSDQSTLKCYMGDTGLLVSQSLEDSDFVQNEIYRSILLNKLSINQGMFVENIIAQTLASNGHKLFFYSCSDNDNPKNTMEIDFLLTSGKKVCPIEVKSGAYKAHRSLDKFKDKFGFRVGTRYVVHTKDLRVENDVIYIPLYMAAFL